MEMKLDEKKSNSGGYTLVELIMVIAILSMLSVIVMPKLSNFKVSAQDRVDTINAKALTKVAQEIYAETGSFPQWPLSFTDLASNTTPYFEKDIGIQNPDNKFYYDASTGTVIVGDSRGAILNLFPHNSDKTLVEFETGQNSLRQNSAFAVTPGSNITVSPTATVFITDKNGDTKTYTVILNAPKPAGEKISKSSLTDITNLITDRIIEDDSF